MSTHDAVKAMAIPALNLIFSTDDDGVHIRRLDGKAMGKALADGTLVLLAKRLKDCPEWTTAPENVT